MLEKVTDRIYYLMNDNKDERPALGLVKGNNCCLVIDAGNSIKHAKEFMNEIKNMELPPINYVIATHHHWDHIFGLRAFDAVKIASKATFEQAKIYWGMEISESSLEAAKKNHIFDEVGVNILKAELHNIDRIEEIKFDLLFQGELEIDLGGVTCYVKEMVNPHRCDGAIVYVPQEKTLFLGDAAYGCSKEGKSCYDRKKLVSMMSEVNSYNADYYLCSHESICDKDEMKWYFDKLTMGLEITKGSDKLQDIVEKYKEIYHMEPTDTDLFFLESIYE